MISFNKDSRGTEDKLFHHIHSHSHCYKHSRIQDTSYSCLSVWDFVVRSSFPSDNHRHCNCFGDWVLHTSEFDYYSSWSSNPHHLYSAGSPYWRPFSWVDSNFAQVDHNTENNSELRIVVCIYLLARTKLKWKKRQVQEKDIGIYHRLRPNTARRLLRIVPETGRLRLTGFPCRKVKCFWPEEAVSVIQIHLRLPALRRSSTAAAASTTVFTAVDIGTKTISPSFGKKEWERSKNWSNTSTDTRPRATTWSFQMIQCCWPKVFLWPRQDQASSKR